MFEQLLKHHTFKGFASFNRAYISNRKRELKQHSEGAAFMIDKA